MNDTIYLHVCCAHFTDALRTLGEEEGEITDDVIPVSKSADSLLSTGGSTGSSTSTPVRNPNQAERELARLRSINYSISDIIDDIGTDTQLNNQVCSKYHDMLIHEGYTKQISENIKF